MFTQRFILKLFKQDSCKGTGFAWLEDFECCILENLLAVNLELCYAAAKVPSLLPALLWWENMGNATETEYHSFCSNMFMAFLQIRLCS